MQEAEFFQATKVRENTLPLFYAAKGDRPREKFKQLKVTVRVKLILAGNFSTRNER